MLTWGLVQLLQHGVDAVVKEELQDVRRPSQQRADDAPQLLAHQAVWIVWGGTREGRV